MRIVTASLLLVSLGGALQALEVTDGVVIYEVYYDAAGNDLVNEYIEIMNHGSATVYLDGAVITDAESDMVTEAVYRFPGQPGGADIPFAPGEILLIAVDAIADGLPPELQDADWESYYPGDLYDNPEVPNLVLCVTSYTKDIALSNSDGILIATGADTTAPVDCETVVDGVNWESVTVTVPISSTVCVDPAPDSGSATGQTIGRCPTFDDHNVDSEGDWFPMDLTPGEVNIPIDPEDCKSPVSGTTWGLLKALYRS